MKSADDTLRHLSELGFTIPENWKHKAIQNGNYLVEICFSDYWYSQLVVNVIDGKHQIHEKSITDLIKGCNLSILRKEK